MRRGQRRGQQYREQQRGAHEHSQQLRALREKWPLAFPVREQDVRPLALNVARQIAETMGWSTPYAHGVLRVRLKTSSRIAELSQHEPNGGEFQECEAERIDENVP